MEEIEEKLEALKKVLEERNKLNKTIETLSMELQGCNISRELAAKHGLKMTHELVDTIGDNLTIIQKLGKNKK